ncbi:D-alanine--D-alanine ligase [Agromyces sp. Root81]|uniref:D-alanine--(R)-lactate ligase n=1 Tax=Agromyces sp. Root81 TaxID=1736601 RepID=UPI0007001F2E|nr:D-alanine--(R)-lactate ligase [Agromyces sp. Root81]KRC62426.1 D-alanine--D-alanine ligase [Agromyces sp. Root81]
MKKTKIGILFGGASEEHPVSIKSAREVAQSLDPNRYEPYWIGITTEGEWRLCDGPDLSEGEFRSATLSPDRSVLGLLVLVGDRHERIRLDVVFPVLHGKFGEDGAIQGLLELSGIPYVGCDVSSSALCMDKALTYAVVRGARIPTPEFRNVEAHEQVDPSQFHYPVFVKPARSGSSFGVTKVTGAEDLAAALKAARKYDTRILIEQAVVGREVGCAILGDGSDLLIGEVDRVALSHGFFRIHQEESPESGSENSAFIVPADISEDERLRVVETAKAVYRALGCRGLARVDLFLADDGRLLLNEVNTLPGLTSYSRYPRMMAAAGLSLSEVIDRLVSDAMERGDR